MRGEVQANAFETIETIHSHQVWQGTDLNIGQTPKNLIAGLLHCFVVSALSERAQQAETQLSS